MSLLPELGIASDVFLQMCRAYEVEKLHGGRNGIARFDDITSIGPRVKAAVNRRSPDASHSLMSSGEREEF